MNKTKQRKIYSAWECSKRVFHEYEERALGKQQLICANQIAKLVKQYFPGKGAILDAGCGMGYFYHAVNNFHGKLNYYGLDISPMLIKRGRQILSKFGLNPKHLMIGGMSDLSGKYDVVICMNTLCFLPDYKLYIDRLCQASKKLLIIRTSLGKNTRIRYLRDGYLDRPFHNLKVHFNTYSLKEVRRFIQSRGFKVIRVRDEFNKDRFEFVAGKKRLERKILVCLRQVKT